MNQTKISQKKSPPTPPEKKIYQFNQRWYCSVVEYEKINVKKVKKLKKLNTLMAKERIKIMGQREWVDIGAPKKERKISTLWKSKGKQEKISKVRPLAKATRMTKSQKASAVSRKRAAGNPGGKPTNVKTFTKRNKKKTYVSGLKNF